MASTHSLNIPNTVDARTRVFVVSVADAVARRTAFDLASSGATYTYFDAHRSLASDLTYDPELVRRRFGRELKPGELGCYSSHFSLWRRLLEDDTCDQYVILEDDVIVDWEFLNQICRAKHGLNYIRLYFKRFTDFRIIDREFVQVGRTLIELYGHAYGTQGYLVTKEGAQVFCRHLGMVQRPVDDAMDRVWDHGVRNFAVFPFPIIERSAESDIGERRRVPRGLIGAIRRGGIQAAFDKLAFHIGRAKFKFGIKS
jgi:glycosyl transferase family 25